MGTKYFFIIVCASISLPLFFFEFCFSADDTITSVRSIRDGTVLVSSGQSFELGFFSPLNSKNRYIGIWYKVTPDVVVWVANRNNPLTDSYGEFGIGEKGNLVLLDAAKSVIWASNASWVAKNPVARLLDSGNFVLEESGNMSPEYYLWQSFDYPTDTGLEGMKLGWDLKRGFERYVTSWKEVSDPSEGKFTAKVDIKGLSQLIIAEGSTRKSRRGPWDGLVEYDEFKLRKNSEFKINFVNNENESCYSFELTNKSVVTRLRLNSAGKVERLSLQRDTNEWIILYVEPYRTCTNYGYCGANAVCGGVEDKLCQCLTGFTPSSEEEWEYRNWSKGCVRTKPFACHNGDGFVKLRRLKWPDLLHFWLNKRMSLEECRVECLKNCSCVAYANSDVRDRGSGCLLWFGDLIDMRYLSATEFDQNIYVRLSASEIKSIERKRRQIKIKIAVSISLGMCSFIILIWCITWRSRKRATGELKDDKIELPIFELAVIKVSTNNFSPTNMLGEGGFGAVYNGTLLNGQEIAVKRLAKNSSQGLKEFKNEVELIEKLQHKNLVSLLGCCINGIERLLVYEYMPNKSLDHYIFDNKGSKLSSWEKNFEIIMGIARGLLYLHQDSKLPIIHRDLKAANVLLDSNMNPKISDFGLARIFDGGEKENRTRTIVGT